MTRLILLPLFVFSSLTSFSIVFIYVFIISRYLLHIKINGSVIVIVRQEEVKSLN